MVPKVELPKEEQKKAEQLGGSEPREPYVRRDTTPPCDRGGHRERSQANDDNREHERHWRNNH